MLSLVEDLSVAFSTLSALGCSYDLIPPPSKVYNLFKSLSRGPPLIIIIILFNILYMNANNTENLNN